MLCLILIVGGLLIVMGQHDRSEALFYYFRLEDHVPETHLLRLIEKHISFAFVRESLPVAFVSAAFAERASIRFGMALFPVLAHRTGQAHLAHPALGESFTISPTEGCLSE
jgi:hypothetical protein